MRRTAISTLLLFSWQLPILFSHFTPSTPPTQHYDPTCFAFLETKPKNGQKPTRSRGDNHFNDQTNNHAKTKTPSNANVPPLSLSREKLVRLISRVKQSIVVPDPLEKMYHDYKYRSDPIGIPILRQKHDYDENKSEEKDSTITKRKTTDGNEETEEDGGDLYDEFFLDRNPTEILKRKRDDLISTLASKILSPESTRAITTIRTLISRLVDDHGVVDIFSKYKPKTVLLAIVALSRLQRASLIYSARDASEDDFFGDSACTSNSDSDIEGDNESNNGRIEEESGSRLALSSSRDLSRLLSLVARNNSRRSGEMMQDDNVTMDDLDMEPDVSDTLLEDLARYAVYANVAYGWTMSLALFGRLHWGDRKLLTTRTGIRDQDVILTHWRAQTHRPAFFLVRDTERQNLVLSIRGTWSANDVLTDLCATAEEFECEEPSNPPSSFQQLQQALPSSSKEAVQAAKRLGRRILVGGGDNNSMKKGRAHQGMLDGARGVAEMTRETIEREMAANPEYSLVIVGHSLGGGTAAILGTMWRDLFPGLKVYAYGCPCVGPLDSQVTQNHEGVVSVVAEGDPFSNLSLGHLADLTRALSRLCEEDELRSEVLRRTTFSVSDMSHEAMRWCQERMEELREEVMTGEKFYPPGNVLRLMGGSSLLPTSASSRSVGGNLGTDDCRVVPVSPTMFQDLTIHPRMFDISRHIPNRYELALKQVWETKQKLKGIENERKTNGDNE